MPICGLLFVGDGDRLARRLNGNRLSPARMATRLSRSIATTVKHSAGGSIVLISRWPTVSVRADPSVERIRSVQRAGRTPGVHRAENPTLRPTEKSNHGHAQTRRWALDLHTHHVQTAAEAECLPRPPSLHQ